MSNQPTILLGIDFFESSIAALRVTTHGISQVHVTGSDFYWERVHATKDNGISFPSCSYLAASKA